VAKVVVSSVSNNKFIIEKELTAAGLSGIFTRFPFNPFPEWEK